MGLKAVVFALSVGMAGTAFGAEGKWVVITSPGLKEAVGPLVKARAADT